MSRKSLILCLAALAAMILGTGIAVAFLYSGTGDRSDRSRSRLSDDGRYELLYAVPSDAVLVGCFSRASSACAGPLAGFSFPSALSAAFEDGSLASFEKSDLTVSMHYSGKLLPLYVFDASRATEEGIAAMETLASEKGMSFGKTEDAVLVSESESLVRSALRHVDKRVSVVDAPGFVDAASASGGDDVLIMSHVHAQKLMGAMVSDKLVRKARFFEKFADWCVFDVKWDGDVLLDGRVLYDGDANEFLTVLASGTPAVSSVSEVLPSYTLSALALPLKKPEMYVEAYKAHVDSRQELQGLQAKQAAAEKRTGMAPEKFFENIGISEIAQASFKVAGNVEKVNLMKVRKSDVISSGEYPYSGYAALVFGNMFILQDESRCNVIGDWVVTGSAAAIAEFTEEKALNYTLKEYLADAGSTDLLAEKPALAVSYLSLTEDASYLSSAVRKDFYSKICGLYDGCDICPVVMTLGKDKEGATVQIRTSRLDVQKTKAPVTERDTDVTVPEGPFKVKNSHTGKMNTFYQNASKAICLRDENGKDLWGVPLGKDICGTAHNVDYYANGKLQIIFGAGSEIYVIDRLSRFVSGFPVNLGKEILIGPDVYDFSGARKYNIIVLHKDNTIEMYNLKGQKPSAWKGITSAETIKSLPERITLGGNDFWVVRTSIQTLIYPFYGGASLTVFEGDKKIRPDSEVKAVDGTSVKVLCYDGKTRTVKLK